MTENYARMLVDLTREAANRCGATLGAPYWDSSDKYEGVYCLACAKKLFPKTIDGGWTGEEDSPPYCERCNVPLDFTFTNEGVERMLEAIEECGIHSYHDAYCVHRMLNASGNPLLTESCGDWDYRPEWKPRIRAIYERASHHEA